jgi:CBS domain-containing protein
MNAAQSGLTVGDLMTPNPLVFDTWTPAPVAEELLTQRGVSGAPVVDALSGVVGVLSQTDLVRARVDGRDDLQGRTVGELMSVPSLSVPPAMPLGEAAALMAAHRVHRLVVLGTDSQAVGVITAFDLIRAMALAVGGELHATAS